MMRFRDLISFWSKFLGFHIIIVFGGVFILAIVNEFIKQPAAMTTLTFWLAVIADILPAIIIVLIVLWLASRFMQAVYGLNSKLEGFRFLVRNWFGQPGFRPYVKIDHGKLPANANIVLTRIGGRGHLIVGNDSAVVLQKGGQLTRVIGPSFIKLAPFEKIYDTVDLRPKCQVCSVKAMTKESIAITWDVEIRYQVADGEQKPSEKLPYPFSEDDVFQAATSKRRRDKDIIDWEKLVIANTEGTLRSILAKHPLDQLVGLSEGRAQVVRESIQKELAQVLTESVKEVGARILGVTLHNLQVDDETTQQWIKTWQARYQQAATLEFAPTQIEQSLVYEMAKAEAQRLPLTTLYRELEKQDPSQAIKLMVLTYFYFRLEEQMRAEAMSKYFPSVQIPDIPELGKDESKPIEPPPEEDGDSFGSSIHEPQPNSSERPKPFLRVLPIISEVVAGKAKPVLDDIEGYIQQIGELEFRLAEQADEQVLQAQLLKGSQLEFIEEYNYFVTKISGDSMDQADISPGDYIILQKSSRAESGDIVAVVFRDNDNKATLKRILIQLDGVTLKPESSNPKYQPYSLPLKAFGSNNPPLEVIGIAIAVLKNIN